MSEFVKFGNPDRFELSLRWASDSEPLSSRPMSYGWSIGDLSITVGGQLLTLSRRGEAVQRHVGWYLAPVFEWLAANWTDLLHEEDFAWHEKSAAPASVACHREIQRWIAASDGDGRRRYRNAQAWYRRHALRTASAGGLFPDLFIRRLADDIELSWTAQPPQFAPDGFAFVLEPGVAYLSVEDVAVPLWNALTWLASEPPKLTAEDIQHWRALCDSVNRISALPESTFEAAYVSKDILDVVKDVLTKSSGAALAHDEISTAAPFISKFAPAVAMFGGVSPRLSQNDVEMLCSKLMSRQHLSDSQQLSVLVRDRRSRPVGVPHSDGLQFADEFLDEIGRDEGVSWIDVRRICQDLQIDVCDVTFETDSIRGVAIAGEGFGPSIILNNRSYFNDNEEGRRFSIAHELCHILFDRTRARRITHVSGPWVAPGIEKRANAFAAYLLMPRFLVLEAISGNSVTSETEVSTLAKRLHVSESALVEHLYNIDLIDEEMREHLRAVFHRSPSRNSLNN